MNGRKVCQQNENLKVLQKVRQKVRQKVPQEVPQKVPQQVAQEVPLEVPQEVVNHIGQQRKRVDLEAANRIEIDKGEVKRKAYPHEGGGPTNMKRIDGKLHGTPTVTRTFIEDNERGRQFLLLGNVIQYILDLTA